MAFTVLALPVALIAFVVALVRRGTVTVGIGEHAGVVAAARRTRGWRVVGLAVGLVAAGLLLSRGQDLDSLGRLTALAPTALGAGVLLGTVVGEVGVRATAGVRRSAAVEARSVRDVLPRGRAVVLGVSAALLAATLGVGAAWGSPDDMGRAGRAVTMQCTRVLDGTSVVVGSSRGPWPGSYYAVPLALALAAVGLLTALALWVVARRPRPDLEGAALDTMLRRWSAGNVLAAATVTVAGTLAPVAALVGTGLGGGACDLGVGASAVRWAALVVAPLAAAVAGGMLGSLLGTPTIRVDDLPRALPGDAAPVGAPVR